MIKRKPLTLSFDKADDPKRSFTLDLNMSGVIMNIPQNDEERRTMMSEFGLFGSDSDSNKYYHDIEGASDVIPKPEDFIKVPFRLISATTVGAGSWKATQFSEEVLKASMERLRGKPVYKEHDQNVDNWVGTIESVKWTPAKMDGGETIPAGIDGVLSIDAKTNPKVARGLLTGAIFSNSVTVTFDWKPSHEFDNDDDFIRHIGRFGSDGKMVRRVATQVFDFYETSLVWLGADPYAKQRGGDGNLMHVDDNSAYNAPEFDKVPEAVQKQYTDNHRYNTVAFDKSYNRLSGRATPQQNSDTMKEFFEKLAAKSGLTLEKLMEKFGFTKSAEQITEEEFKAAFAKLNTATTEQPSEDTAIKAAAFDKLAGLGSFTAVMGESVDLKELSFDGVEIAKTETLKELRGASEKVTKLEQEKTSLTDKINSLEPRAKIGDSFMKQQREEAKRLYKTSLKGEPSDAVIGLFDKANEEELKGLLKQYVGETTSAFSGRCADCKSDNFEFRSSLASTESEDDVEDIDSEDVGMMSILERRSKKSINLIKS